MDFRYFERRRQEALLRELFDAPGAAIFNVIRRALIVVMFGVMTTAARHIHQERVVWGVGVRHAVERAEKVGYRTLAFIRSLEERGKQ